MKTRALIACCIVMLSAGAMADEASKAAKLRELMELQKMTEVVEDQRVRGLEQAKEMASNMTAEIRRQMPNVSQEFLAEVETVSADFIDAVGAAWTTEQAINEWGRFYGEHVTEDELDQIIAFYRSPVGMKNTLAAHNAMPKWQAFMEQSSGPVTQAAMAAYVERLQDMARRAQAAENGE